MAIPLNRAETPAPSPPPTRGEGTGGQKGLASLAKAAGFRLFNSVALLLAVVVLNFILINSAPGDPAEVIAGEMGGSTPEIMA